jgi:hypothetical protein
VHATVKITAFSLTARRPRGYSRMASNCHINGRINVSCHRHLLFTAFRIEINVKELKVQRNLRVKLQLPRNDVSSEGFPVDEYL